jgi:CubicO group peptidase (beta-lactamase class C family)
MIATRRAPLAVLVVSLLVAAAPLAAADQPQSLATALPEDVGLSSERLARIGEVMDGYVEAGAIPGAIGVVARRGKIAYFETFGFADRESKKPMAKDTLFRMYSMTKAVTGVAVMILHEEAGFSLTTPVSRWLPELKNLQVAVESVDAATGDRRYRLEPAARELTVADLLRHTDGLSYAGPFDEKGERAYEKLGVGSQDQTLEEFVAKLAKAPLHDHPGTVFRYGYGMDVLGRLVEVISGQRYDRFLEERIFRPLGMGDTAFYAPAAKKERLATLYAPSEDGGIKRSLAPAQTSFLSEPKIFWGGAGLVSTAMDYLRFSLMLLNGGELEGVRLLSRKSVELMASDHLGDLPRVGLLGEGDGFGFTFRVNLSPGKNGALGSVGEYGWGGAAGTRFFIDPQEEMVTLFFIQILPHQTLTYGSELKNLVYQSIVD